MTADRDDDVLLSDLKKRAAKLPAEHVQLIFEFLAQHAELFGLLEGQPDCVNALHAAFAVFIPGHDVLRSEELFDDAVGMVGEWKANEWDGQREFAERSLDLALRVLAPPIRKAAA